MRRLYIGAIIVVFTLVIVATVLTIPSAENNIQRVAATFLGILGGGAAIAEIAGLFDRFKFSLPSKQETPPSDVIRTTGDYSPGKVGGDYIVGQSAKSKPKTVLPEQMNKSNIQTEGDYSPGVVKGDYVINQSIITQYEANIRKQWRNLEYLPFPLIIENTNSRTKFAADLAFALDKVFAKTGYTKFNAIFRCSTLERLGQEFPTYELVCHQAEFCEAIRQEYARFIQNILDIREQTPGAEGKARMRQMIKEEREAFHKQWNITAQFSISSQWTPLELIYDPATHSIAIQFLDKLSVNPVDYSDGIKTTSELLCFIAALSQTAIGYFGDLVWYEDNYSLMKLFVDVLDKRTVGWEQIRINANDYEEWDYINPAFDEEVKGHKTSDGKANSG